MKRTLTKELEKHGCLLERHDVEPEDGGFHHEMLVITDSTSRKYKCPYRIRKDEVTEIVQRYIPEASPTVIAPAGITFRWTSTSDSREGAEPESFEKVVRAMSRMPRWHFIMPKGEKYLEKLEGQVEKLDALHILKHITLRHGRIPQFDRSLQIPQFLRYVILFHLKGQSASTEELLRENHRAFETHFGVRFTYGKATIHNELIKQIEWLMYHGYITA